MRLLVAIPTRSNWSGLEALSDFLWADGHGHDTIIYDHGHVTGRGRRVLGSFARVVDARGWPFYRMWNEAWRTAHRQKYDAVALLNDDITLAPGGLTVAAHLLAADPTIGVLGLNWGRPCSAGVDATQSLVEVVGAHRRGGVPGWAFLLRASLWGEVPPIDEAYHIWYGDDHLFASARAANYRLCVASGVPVEHATSMTLRQHPELLVRTSDDEQRFLQHWNTLYP